MRLAVVNPSNDISPKTKEVRIEAGLVTENGKQIGKVVSEQYIKVIENVPTTVELPKNLLTLKGKGVVVDRFTYSYRDFKRDGIIVEFTKEVIESNKEAIKVLSFTIIDKKSTELLDLINGFNKTRYVEVKLTDSLDRIILEYNGKQIAYKIIRAYSEKIPDCTGVVISINDNHIKVQAKYDPSKNSSNTELAIKNFKDQYPEIYTYLNDCNIDPFFIKKIYESYRNYGDLSTLIPEPQKLYLDEDNKVKIIISSVLRGKNIRLIGPRSTGKNVLADTIAWIFQRPVLKISMNEETDKYEIVGSPSLVTVTNQDGSGHSVTTFEEHYLPIAMRNGCILLLDEVNTADSGVLSLFHSVLDTSRSYTLQTGEKIIADKNFFVISTMNKGYEGTKELNSAFVDRFVPITVNYFKKITPVLMQGREPIIDSNTLNKIESVYNEIIDGINNKTLDESCMSVRGFEDVLDLVEDGFNIKVALEVSLINRANEYFAERLQEVINLFFGDINEDEK